MYYNSLYGNLELSTTIKGQNSSENSTQITEISTEKNTFITTTNTDNLVPKNIFETSTFKSKDTKVDKQFTTISKLTEETTQQMEIQKETTFINEKNFKPLKTKKEGKIQKESENDQMVNYEELKQKMLTELEKEKLQKTKEIEKLEGNLQTEQPQILEERLDKKILETSKLHTPIFVRNSFINTFLLSKFRKRMKKP